MKVDLFHFWDYLIAYPRFLPVRDEALVLFYFAQQYYTYIMKLQKMDKMTKIISHFKQEYLGTQSISYGNIHVKAVVTGH